MLFYKSLYDQQKQTQPEFTLYKLHIAQANTVVS